MYNLKGFINFRDLVNNVSGQVATIGELSAESRTYERDIRVYSEPPVQEDTQLFAFHSVRDDSDVIVPNDILPMVLRMGQYIHDQMVADTIGTSSAVFISQIQTEFSGDISTFSHGPIIENTSLSSTCPTWVEFRVLGIADSLNTVKLWFSDTAFANEYPHYSYEIIAPIDDVDDFFGTPEAVETLLNAYSLPAKLSEADTISNGSPYTKLVAQSYDFKDPNDSSFSVPSQWLIIVYGRSGDNPDLIRNALVAHILAESSSNEAAWIEILPSLFLRTEYIFVPNWGAFSIPNEQLQGGLFQPVIQPEVFKEHMVAMVEGVDYTQSYIEDNYEMTFILYKSLSMGVIGNPNNQSGATQFSDDFDDYIVVTNTSADFNRMSLRTQAMSTLLTNLAIAAQTLSISSALPTGISRVVRNDVEFVAGVYDNITFMVVGKPHFDAYLASL